MITRIKEWWILRLGRIDSKAALWVARSERGLNVEERADLDKWLSEDPRHEEAYFETQVIWQGMDILSGGATAGSSSSSKGFGKVKWASWVGGLAATVVLGLTIWMVGFRTIEEETQAQPTVFESSGYKRHVLDDGSTMELKPGTRLTLTYTASKRLVHLEEGESFFTVASDPDRPFAVESRLGVVTAIGTAFTVKLAGVLAEVWVTEGKVKVTKPEIMGEVVATIVPAETEVAAGQMMIQHLTDNTYESKVVSVSQEEIEVQLEWKDRILQFVSAPLYEIVAEFNRLNDVKIILLNDELKTERLTIAMEPDNYRDFARMLELSLDAQIEYSDKIIFVSSD